MSRATSLFLLAGIFYCGYVAYARTGSVMVGIAVSWGMWVLAPWAPSQRG